MYVTEHTTVYSGFVNTIEADDKMLLGPVNGKFPFKKKIGLDVTVDRRIILFNFRSKVSK